MRTTLVGSRYFHSTLNKVVKHVEKHNYRFIEVDEGKHKKLVLVKSHKEKS